jgi:thiamine biosynthesis lipoprotein
LSLLLLLVLPSGCGSESPAITSRVTAFGDVVDVSLVSVEPQQAERAMALLEQEFATLDRDLNTWSDGQMARVNRLLPTGEAFEAPVSILPLVLLSQRYAELSNNLFNPAIGKLIALWGFNVEVPEGMRPPPEHAIQQLLQADPKMADVEVNILTLQGSNSALRLDFSPIVKAYAIDLAIAQLRALDIRNAQIKSGSDLRAIGSRGGQPWRIPIRRASGSGVFATLNVQGDESVVTRSAHDRDWIYDGVTYHHILDPRNGRPVRETQSVTVIHPEATVAAAAAVALFVAGPEAWHGVAEALGIRYAALVDDAGTVHLNPELLERITIIDRDASLELSPPLGLPASS